MHAQPTFNRPLPRLTSLALLCSAAVPSFAGLEQITGQTEAELALSQTIDKIWVGNGFVGTTKINTFTGQTNTFLQQCRKMEQTGNAIVGTGATAFSLGLGKTALLNGLQAIAPEELTAQVRSSIETAGRNPISGRLLELRGFGAGGMRLGGGPSITVNGMAMAAPDGLQPAGGGAGETTVASRWGGFANLNYNTGSRSGSGREDPFDFSDKGATVGADYRFSDHLVLGAALAYSKNNADFGSSNGSVDTKNTGISFYGSYTVGDWYLDGHMGYAKLDFDTARIITVPSANGVPGISTTAFGTPAGHQFTTTIGGGRDFHNGNLTITPYVRLDYLHQLIDPFTESEPNLALGFDVSGRNTTSLQSALGGRFTWALSTSRGVVSPYLGIEWNHEYKDSSNVLVAKYTYDPFSTYFSIPTDNPQRDFVTLTAGVSATFPRGVSAFVNVDSMQGASRTRNTGIVLGLRGEF